VNVWSCSTGIATVGGCELGAEGAADAAGVWGVSSGIEFSKLEPGKMPAGELEKLGGGCEEKADRNGAHANERRAD
jgi:hypothetical protein